MGKVMAFMYRGDIPDSYRKSLEDDPSIRLPLSQRFPTTDNFLTTLLGEPKTISLSDGTTVTTDVVTNEEKWAILLKKQAALIQPYNTSTCNDYAEVIAEVDVYAAADKLEIPALKDVAMNKVNDWLELELQAGSPLSNDFRACAIYVLREHKDFAASFIALCARYLLVVEEDAALKSLLEAQHPLPWNAMISVRLQWAKEVRHQRKELDLSQRQVYTLKNHINQQEKATKDVDEDLQSEVKKLSESLNWLEAAWSLLKTRYLSWRILLEIYSKSYWWRRYQP